MKEAFDLKSSTENMHTDFRVYRVKWIWINFIVELAEHSPIIIQTSSNPSSRKDLDVQPYDRTRCYF